MNLKIVGGLWCALCAGTSIYLFVKKSKKDDAMYDRALARGSIAGKSYNQIMDEDIQDRFHRFSEAVRRLNFQSADPQSLSSGCSPFAPHLKSTYAQAVA